MTGKRFRFETVPCPLCGSRDFKALGTKVGGYYERDGGHEAAQVTRCRDCGLICANPMPFPERQNLVDFYNQDYTGLLSEFIPYEDRKSDFVDILEGHRRLERLEAILGRRGSLLDIGCGPGNLLRVAQERGWEAVGLEINDDSARFAREVNGVDVVTGPIQDYADQWPRHFDATHFNQVLEHTYEPIGFLRAVRKVMRSNGCFFCGVPNEDSLMNNVAQVYFKIRLSKFTPMLAPTFPPYHVLGFSPKTIRLMLQKGGFKVICIERVNYSSIDFSAFKNGQVLKGLESVVGVIAGWLGEGHGLDVYGVPA